MTTIAYRDGVIAGDRRIHNHGVSAWGVMTKIARSPAGLIGGSCGQPALIARFTDWLKTNNGEMFQPTEEEDWEGFTVDAMGCVLCYDKYGTHMIQASYLAIGTGKEFAYGAFYAGASAEVAVQAAIAHSGDSGDGIDLVSLS